MGAGEAIDRHSRPVVGVDGSIDPLGSLDDQVVNPGLGQVPPNVVGTVEHGRIRGATNPFGEIQQIVADDQQGAPGASSRAAREKAARRSGSGTCR